MNSVCSPSKSRRTAPSTRGDFFRRVTSSGVLTEREFDRAVSITAGVHEPVQIARRLIAHQLMTPWQSNRLLKGYTSLLIAGKYQLLNPVGAGGMGVVYRARHAGLRRSVAVKLLHARHLQTDRLVQRFEREVQLTARLDHRHVVQALDAGRERRLLYLVTEFVDGPTLKACVQDCSTGLPVGWCCRIAAQIASALSHAHERGVIHRDLKPANILVAGDVSTSPQAKIVDFGLSCGTLETDLEKTLTLAGTTLGTVAYIAPEQAEAADRAEARSDLFSLGCILYEMLSGHVPFPGRTLGQQLLSRCTQPARPLRGRRPEVSAQLEALVLRLLAQQPRQRPATADEVVTALAPFA